MKATKSGLWIDHDHAYLIEFTTEPMKAVKIESPLHTSKKPNLRFGEKRKHATEQRGETSYYKKLIELIQHYKEVILFGPGTARDELFNLLGKGHTLQTVDVKTAHIGRLTPRQMSAFVRKHFTAPHPVAIGSH